MHGTALILETPSVSLAPLLQVLRDVVPNSWEVRSVASLDELTTLTADRGRCYLVVAVDSPEGQPPTILEVIAAARTTSTDVPVVVAAAEGAVDSARRAVAAGATDYLVLGPRLDERVATLWGKMRPLLEAIDRNRRLDAQNTRLRATIQARFEIIGESVQVRQMLDQIQRVAVVPRPVLIVGERGTGKELVARAIHFAAHQDSRPIVSVNCAAFNDALLESELFGHERGAFTGADTTHRGKFEQADGGTLFLDEIGNMTLAFQQKILRVVEYGMFSRVGGSGELKTTARVIAATNVDLQEKIHSGEFLADLFDRLSFEVLAVPPLRERTGDVEVLSRHFLNQFARDSPAFKGKSLSAAALDALSRYRFPGNIRELKNTIERAAFHDTTNEITPADLQLPPGDDLLHVKGSFHDRLHIFGRRLISEALDQSEGNQAEAARTLGISYHQFRYYYKKYVKGAG
ncbi:MAG: sigma 54-interacting transcriptional regulator [Planctomycetes bacterium]|nr:sigma 54-interacting transcriptional regulator [Planctomycetota bacterium]